jgi:thiol-disulfide isomerase/thioredoxin
MNPLAIFATLLGLVAIATVVGLLWRSNTGRVRGTRGWESRHGDEAQSRIRVAEFSADAVAGTGATLLQFSTDFCAPCRSTHSLLESIAGELNGVEHVDVDVTTRADLATRFNLLQSPTTLILDGRGTVRARIGGAPRPAELRAELGRILEESALAA